jgi:hypothetical protein
VTGRNMNYLRSGGTQAKAGKSKGAAAVK